MIAVDLREDNWSLLKEMNKQDFIVPINDPLLISKKVIIENNQIIGSGMVKITTEGILILDESIPVDIRVNALKLLIKECQLDLEKKNIHECHVFVKNERFQRVLAKLGFQFCKGGTPMIFQF